VREGGRVDAPCRGFVGALRVEVLVESNGGRSQRCEQRDSGVRKLRKHAE
jgi:hypothetical protein